MEINLEKESINVFKALASETRIEIINILAENPCPASELAKKLGLTKAIVSRHLLELEDARLIHLSDSKSDGRKKVYVLNVDHINVNFPSRIYLPFKKKVNEIKLGLYSDFNVAPTCGLASVTAVIGEFDDPRSFVDNARADAELLWFSKGYVEYKVPNLLAEKEHPELLELSLELSSEFPDSNNTWPSDITFSINGVELGTVTAPGNFSDVRGRLTPAWWDDKYSQYGNLIHIRVSHDDTGVDGHFLSTTTIDDLHLSESPLITLRIEAKDTAANPGGVTIFGEKFGNEAQNILMGVWYT